MSIKIGINGFGRIGRLVMRAALTAARVLVTLPRLEVTSNDKLDIVGHLDW